MLPQKIFEKLILIVRSSLESKPTVLSSMFATRGTFWTLSRLVPFIGYVFFNFEFWNQWKTKEYITDADLRIGNVISVWGRPLKLVSCDDFTKNYYATKYNVNGFNALENKALPKEKQHVAKQVIFLYNLK